MYKVEIWKDIKGYEKLYQISSLGRVRNSKNDILYQSQIKGGYKRVQLHKNGNIKSYLVHRLVAETFIPNPNNKSQVNHLNGITSDNKLKNLEWCTPSENVQYAYKYGKMADANVNRAFSCKKRFSKKVLQYDLKMNLINNFSSLHEASKFSHISISHLSRCCNKKIFQVNNYIWRYEEGGNNC